jgi:dTDP-glucose 4,6-dehydratase
LNDAITEREIRIHGDGSARRNYLYGSDLAWWILATLVNFQSGGVYNLGSANPATHFDLIKLICERTTLKPKLNYNAVLAT